MKKTRWFLTFLKNVDFSTTKEIPKIFPQAKFVVISQEDLGNFILRKIAFVIGPYLLCKATNKTKKNELINQWTKENPEIPFGKILQQCSDIKKILVSKTSNSRKYKIIGSIESEIEEEFFEFKNMNIAVFCGQVHSLEIDLLKSQEFIKKNINSDIYLFPETFPYSRNFIGDLVFPNGTIFGRYSNVGPETFFVSKKIINLKKNTLFANEKTALKRGKKPSIIYYKGLKIAVIICYDLLNPKISYLLSKENVDLILVPSMIPKEDIIKWKNFMYTRGEENECPIILTSNEDKRKLCSSIILIFDPIKEKVLKYNSSKRLIISFGEKILESPKVHWSWLLKNRIFGPFIKDF